MPARTRTVIHTTYIRTSAAGREGSARLHGLVEYATISSAAVRYARMEGLEEPTWHRGYGAAMALWEAHAWIDEQYAHYTYARTVVLSPPPETRATLWLDEQRGEWVGTVMRAMGYRADAYIYTWHDDPEHPHAHVIAVDDRALTRAHLAAGREAGDVLARTYAQEIAQDQEIALGIQQEITKEEEAKVSLL